MEATGIYHENLAWKLFNLDFKVIIVLPNKAKKYLQSLGLKSKNDKIDAQGLSNMCASQAIECWKPISKKIYELRSLTRLHEDISVQHTGFSNRLHAYDYAMHELKDAIKSVKKILTQMAKQKELVEQKIKKLITNDVELNKKYEMISKIKGVGLISFAVLVAETDGFANFNNVRQLTSYAGYDVVENQSGARTGKTRISKKGNSHIRRIMHMPALNVVKFEPIFKSFYERIYDKTGIKMKGYVAVQRKLLSMIYTLWKKNEAFNPLFISPLSVKKIESKTEQKNSNNTEQKLEQKDNQKAEKKDEILEERGCPSFSLNNNHAKGVVTLDELPSDVGIPSFSLAQS
ncbi:MAG: IS110 family transposase [Bacteroidetes bacterium]|nr:MAG: IS110 family transposase [Bacteroidota bacterium]